MELESCSGGLIEALAEYNPRHMRRRNGVCWRNQILPGDCREVLPRMPDSLVDLIVTSPPYADQRKRTYGGIPIDEYVQWFMPIARELHRVLKPTGSFVLNIK